MQTLFAQKKSIATAADVPASALTSETLRGTAPENSKTQNKSIVNQNHSTNNGSGAKNILNATATNKTAAAQDAARQAVTEGRMLCANKNKSQSLCQRLRVQFPQGVTNFSFDTIIRKSQTSANTGTKTTR